MHVCWLSLAIQLATAPNPNSGTVFSHPAGWISSSDIIRIRSLLKAGLEPWSSAAGRLMRDPTLSTNYNPKR